MADEPKAFKDYYGVELAEQLAGLIHGVWPEFDRAAYVETVAARVGPLELKDRVIALTEALHQRLPKDYPQALAILLQILGDPIPDEDGMFTQGFHLYPVAQFVETYGLDDPERSLSALHAITQRFTAEFAIRPFIERYPDETMKTLRDWVLDPSPHVRRLVSEGTRPRLPWASRLRVFETDPGPTLELLNTLCNDPSQYVRRSVANHLNDLTKDKPDLVLETLRSWDRQTTDSTRWITRHALRSLLKQGHPEALALLGYGPPEVDVTDLQVTPAEVVLGDAVTLEFGLTSRAKTKQQLMVDYAVHFVRANGTTGAKVFKLKQLALQPRESTTIRKKHSLKAVTVRRYYPGQHRIEIQVNGQRVAEASFELIV